MIRTRIAPSPTGFFHIGTARTALFNYLFSRKHKGSFIVRIEDTDRERSKSEYEKDILDGLKWLGINWDEGPEKGGEYGPYRQSERFSVYRTYLEQLNDAGFLYVCFCTKEELEEERELQALSKQPPRYSGKCKCLSKSEQNRLKNEGRASTLRFRIERGAKLVVHDHIRGELTFNTDILDDFIIAKDFNTPLYNFAVVIDDYLMKISHIIRGEEHISNVPKQVLLERALGFPIPDFVHLPLILNTDRTKLSKRQNKVSLLEYRADGYLPEALINFMVLLGWNPGSEREFFTLHELEAEFDLAQVNNSGAIFNTDKLDWFNAHYIRKKNISELVDLCKPYFVSAGYSSAKTNFPGEQTVRMEKIVQLERERIHKLSEISDRISYFFAEDIEYDDALLLWKGCSKQDIEEGLGIAKSAIMDVGESDFIAERIESKLKEKIAKQGIKNGVALWPLRVALTGLAASPSPFDIAEILGKKKTLDRIEDALNRLSPVSRNSSASSHGSISTVISVFFLIVAAVLTLFTFSLDAAKEKSDVTILELNQQIRDKRSRVYTLRKQIAMYEQNIRQRQAETISLESEIAIMEDKAEKTRLDLEATEVEIEQLGLEIDQANAQIVQQQNEIDLQKDRLSAFIRQLYEQSEKDYLEILLTNERFSDFFDEVRYLESVQGEVFSTIERLKVLKDQLLAQKNTLELSKERMISLQESLEKIKSQLDEQKGVKQTLIVQSQLSKDKYEQLLNDARAEQLSADSDISSLEKSIREKLQIFGTGKVSVTWPVDPSRGISAYFHDKNYPYRNVFEHPGVDIRAYQGTAVKAAEAGYVARAKDSGMGYSYIMIVHDSGLATVYGHVSRIIVPQDTYVKKGDIIGFSGGTPGTPGAGRLTTGPHLHFEVRLNGIPQDPLKYLP